jgi:AcrR family transcriptional regulator
MKEKLIQKASKIIAQEGLESLSIRKLCKEVNVTAPTVYHYFKDKDELVNSVVEYAYKKYLDRQKHIHKNVTPQEGIKKSWETFFHFVEHESELFHAIIIAHLKMNIPDIGLKIFMQVTAYFESLESQKKLFYDARNSNRLLYASAYGMALIYVSQNKNPEIKKLIPESLDMCLKHLIKDA